MRQVLVAAVHAHRPQPRQQGPHHRYQESLLHRPGGLRGREDNQQRNGQRQRAHVDPDEREPPHVGEHRQVADAPEVADGRPASPPHALACMMAEGLGEHAQAEGGGLLNGAPGAAGEQGERGIVTEADRVPEKSLPHVGRDYPADEARTIQRERARVDIHIADHSLYLAQDELVENTPRVHRMGEPVHMRIEGYIDAGHR